MHVQGLLLTTLADEKIHQVPGDSAAPVFRKDKDPVHVVAVWMFAAPCSTDEVFSDQCPEDPVAARVRLLVVVVAPHLRLDTQKLVWEELADLEVTFDPRGCLCHTCLAEFLLQALNGPEVLGNYLLEREEGKIFIESMTALFGCLGNHVVS